MQREVFSPLAIDALGEMMNISLGSSATAVSNMLDRRVDITTPKVSVVDIESFSIAEIEPAMGVEIKYVSGLEGSNIMLLKKEDIKVIVDILMGQESDESEFELNELTVSACFITSARTSFVVEPFSIESTDVCLPMSSWSESTSNTPGTALRDASDV